MSGEAGIDSRTRCTCLGTQHMRQAGKAGRNSLSIHPVATRDDDRCIFDVYLRLFDVAVDDGYNERLLLHEVGYLVLHHCPYNRVQYLFITPSRTVAICGRWSGLMIQATMLPPNAGRI